ncbi:MAG: ribosomal protein S18-alanine N-acetyltransferase [Chloroflexota bacterium]
MVYYARLMQEKDIPQVNEIDHEAFESWWPLTNYAHELENKMAHYVVACDDTGETEAPAEKGFTNLTSMVKQLLGHNTNGETAPAEKVLGFTGFWIMVDEAHIISIAVRKDSRHQGVGELMLMRSIDMALELGASFVTLEARVSNTIAQNLYRKYGFTHIGTRKGYYTDNREDAVIMSTESIASASYQSLMKTLKHAYTKRWGIKLPETARKT